VKLLRMALVAALRALRRNRMRSALTLLGIVIGMAAVIAMVSIGQGANAAVEQQLRSLGPNLLVVVPGATTKSGVRSASGTDATLTVEDARAIGKESSAVRRVSYCRKQVMQAVNGARNWSTLVMGTTTVYPEIREWRTTSGTFFDERDEQTADKVAVIGKTVVRELFGRAEDPVGATIQIANVPFRIVGVLASKGSSGPGQDQDDVVLVPFSTAERRLVGSEIPGRVDMIFVTAVSRHAMGAAEQQIDDLLRERHRIRQDADDDFTVRNLDEIAAAARSTTRVMTIMLLNVAAISLLVGGIGIMNILLVSVTERTREIGVRMAVGAKQHHIVLQFLVEAMTLSTAGGLVGMLVGVVAAAIIAHLAEWPTLLSPTAVAGSFLFSAAIGIFFGLYPARKAARLDPITALRYE